MLAKNTHDYGWLGRNRYGVGAAADSLPLQANIIYRHDLYDADTTPQVGSSTYSRSGTIVVPSKSTLLKSYSADAIPLAVSYNGSEALMGAWFGGAVTNYLQRSEDFTHASWVVIGSGAVSGDTVGAPNGVDNADTISGSVAGDGVGQDSLQAAASQIGLFSVYLKTSSGTQNVRLIIKDEGVDQTFTDVVVTTTWQRFQVSRSFLSTATGNIICQIIVGNSSNVRAWGAQLEKFTSGSAGRRDNRYSVANAYVATAGATASYGSSSNLIPNSIFSQMATKGSMSFWVYTEIDFLDQSTNSPQYFVSANGEQFAIAADRFRGLVLWINNSRAASASGESLTEGNHFGLEPYAWTHVVCTWDTDADTYKIYINAIDRTTETASQTAITTSTYEINVGGYNPALAYLGADAIMSQVVIWNEVLNASEVAQVYAMKSAISRRSEPGDGLIFEVALGTSPIPTTGDKEHYWGNRKFGEFYIPDSPTTLTKIDQNEYPIGYPLNGYNKAGWYFTSQQTNYILQSENIGTTWATIGSPTITASAGTFLGTLNYGTILGVSGEGVSQSASGPIAAASNEFVGSVYASVASGTLACQLVLEGDSGGTPGTVTQSITLTTTPQKFSVYAAFGGSVTGNVRMKFLLNGTGTARVGGFMLERANISSPQGVFYKVGSNYIKTTSAVASNGHNMLIYRMKDSFNIKKGTSIIWAFLWNDPATESIAANGPTLLSAPGQYNAFYWHMGTTAGVTWDHLFNYGGLNGAQETTLNMAGKNVWTQLAISWDQAGSSYKIFKDGVEIASGSSASPVMTQRKLMIGGDFVWAPMDYWQGAIDSVKIYGDVKDEAFILADFNATKATYGR